MALGDLENEVCHSKSYSFNKLHEVFHALMEESVQMHGRHRLLPQPIFSSRTDHALIYI